MVRSLILIIAGVIIGVAASQLHSAYLHDEIEFLQEANVDLESRHAQLQFDLNSALSRPAGISLETAKHCMALSSIRFSAITNHLDGRTLSVPEESEFNRLYATRNQFRTASSERLMIALIQESSRLDNECLGAGIPASGG
mgnify:CR=1 FL=1